MPEVKRRGPNVHIAGATHALHGPAAPQPQRPAKAPAQPKSTPYVHSLGLLYGFSPQEGRGIEGLLNSSQQARNKAELEPLQQKGREITNQEQTANRLYGASTANTNALLGNLVTQGEGSAKTFENTAAENAMAATRSVETAGQNAETATGGYISPELRSILQTTGGNAQSLAQGGVARANELGQANTNYMRQLAAAAAVGAGTGPGGGLAQIANRYQTEAGANRAAENATLARSAARGKEERLNFPREVLTERLARGKLEQAGELGKAKVAATENATATRAATARRGQNITAATARERTRTDAHFKGIDAGIKAGQLRVNELNSADKRGYDKWKMEQGVGAPGGKGAKGGIKYSTSNALKFRSDFGKVESKARAAKLSNRSSEKEFAEARKHFQEEGIDNHLISAALNNIKYGRLGPNDKKYAKEIGAEK